MNLYRYFYTFLLIILTLFNSALYSDNTKETIIEGIIVDGNNKRISGVEVIIPETGEMVKTSATGQFILRTKQRENIHLEINKNGFIPTSVPQFKTVGNQTIRIPKIILLPSPKEEIVVTGTSTPKFYWETPVKTAVISENQIEKKGAVSLADSLEIATGVRVEDNCQNCNFTQVRINGMEGKYCQILFDGLPMVSSLAGVYGLEQIPANRISRLEVVKGGGSALYGGNGVVHLISMDLHGWILI